MPSPNANDAFATPRTSLGFNGQLHEAAASWQLLGNGYRAYNPVLMRFHSADSESPMQRGGMNAYAYCSNEPVNHFDPSGRYALPLVSGVLGIGAIAGAVLVDDVAWKAGLAVAAGVLLAGAVINVPVNGKSLFSRYFGRPGKPPSTPQRKTSETPSELVDRVSEAYLRQTGETMTDAMQRRFPNGYPLPTSTSSPTAGAISGTPMHGSVHGAKRLLGDGDGNFPPVQQVSVSTVPMRLSVKDVPPNRGARRWRGMSDSGISVREFLDSVTDHSRRLRSQRRAH